VIEQARAAELTNRGQFLYSNLGAALLGQALAAATKIDYAQLVHERIFKPLGMTASITPVSAANLPDDAPTGYSATGHDEAAWTMNGSAPAGGIRSTPADMVRYAQALLAGAAPGIATLTPQWDAGTQRIGLAWLTDEVDGKTLTWHNGGTGGFASVIYLDRANNRAIIILSNTAASVTGAGETLITGAGE
jgi:CubicO group peptidase (beta-lactamase class C family)